MQSVYKLCPVSTCIQGVYRLYVYTRIRLYVYTVDGMISGYDYDYDYDYVYTYAYTPIRVNAYTYTRIHGYAYTHIYVHICVPPPPGRARRTYMNGVRQMSIGLSLLDTGPWVLDLPVPAGESLHCALLYDYGPYPSPYPQLKGPPTWRREL